MPATPRLVRNFSIIAHIDHGKSTLADRILEFTGALSQRESREQFLDKMDRERERGITIKAQAVRLAYKAKDGETYQLNLIDTPGHVDFSYEVSRSLAACEGALLVVDATQGVEAQTLANVYLALDGNLEIVPVLNKIDLPSADVDKVKQQIEDVVGLDCSGAIAASAKTGIGIEEILEAVIARVPPPRGQDPDAPLRALVFDSWYDSYRGAVVMLRVVDGTVRKGQKVRFIATQAECEITEMGMFAPFPIAFDALGPGEVGFIAGNIRSVHDTKIGDTVTDAAKPSKLSLPGFKDVKPMVFAGIFPTDSAQFEDLRDALSKLRLNDAAFVFEPDSSEALGFGFRCGFLGLLHMEIIQERLRREYDLDIISTYPSVIYRIFLRDGTMVEVDNPIKLPDLSQVHHMEEPMITAYVLCQNEIIGDMLHIVMDRRGEITKTESLDSKRVMLTCTLPLNEILLDFHDRLKSVSRGYASMDYEPAGYREADLVKMDILVHGEVVEAFSCVLHRDKAPIRGHQICAKLKDIVPAQMFNVALQAAIGGKIIARETIKGARKDVTSKCYGGDISRKRKLLEKQKEGKKKMKQIGSVSLPQEAFIAVLKTGD